MLVLHFSLLVGHHVTTLYYMEASHSIHSYLLSPPQSFKVFTWRTCNPHLVARCCIGANPSTWITWAIDEVASTWRVFILILHVDVDRITIYTCNIVIVMDGDLYLLLSMLTHVGAWEEVSPSLGDTSSHMRETPIGTCVRVIV
eukprot:Gb_15274 [translate_table: standard]